MFRSLLYLFTQFHSIFPLFLSSVLLLFHLPLSYLAISSVFPFSPYLSSSSLSFHFPFLPPPRSPLLIFYSFSLSSPPPSLSPSSVYLIFCTCSLLFFCLSSLSSLLQLSALPLHYIPYISSLYFFSSLFLSHIFLLTLSLVFLYFLYLLSLLFQVKALALGILKKCHE